MQFRTKQKYSFTALVALVVCIGCSNSMAKRSSVDTFDSLSSRDHKVWTTGWKFIRKDVKDAQKTKFNDTSWKAVTVPHCYDVKRAQAGGYSRTGWDKNSYYMGPSWYRREFKVAKTEKGKRFFVKFEAASSVADVYINGKKLGQHKGAFTAFCYELTDHIKFDKPNVMAVRVSNAYREDVPPLSGDFNLFGGIYRPVHFFSTAKTCITPLDYASAGVYLTQKEVSRKKAKVVVSAKVSNAQTKAGNFVMRTTIIDDNNNIVKTTEKDFKVQPGQTGKISSNITINNPRLWDGLEDPYIYTAIVDILEDGKVIDTVCQPLGLRWFKVDAEKGFFLNGRSYQIRGANRHQDRWIKGWALSKADHREDMEIMKEIGLNGIRLAHYPQSHYFYNLCDKNGILVWAEIPLVNMARNTPAYHENAKQQLIELIRQNYNCPSIFTWGLWNELMHKKSSNPNELIKALDRLAKKEDPSRFTTCGANGAVRKAKGLFGIVDYPGFNIYPGWYGGSPHGMKRELVVWNKKGNNRGICVSEYGAGASVLHQQDLPCRPSSIARWHPEQWQAHVHEVTYKYIRNNPRVWGSFVWNLIDFGSHGRTEGSYPGRNDKGLVTYDRKIRKDAFYFYKACWSKKPVLHLASKRFTVRPNANTVIKAYSNCDKVTAYLNGKSLGEKKSDDNIFQWKIKLNEGKNTVRVVGVRDGKTFTDRITWTYDPTFAYPNRWIYASSVSPGNCPEKTLKTDWRKRSNWLARAPKPWIRYMLDDPNKAISEIKIAWTNKRKYNFEIQLSDDTKIWKTVYKGASSGEKAKAYETYKFEATKGKYLRIRCTDNSKKRGLEIYNVIIPNLKPKYYYPYQPKRTDKGKK